MIGFILLGGKGSRMNTRKHLLKLGEETLLERTVRTLSPLFEEIRQIWEKDDPVAGLGPLGGIWAGIKESPSQHSFFIACDMPFVRTDLVKRIIELTPGYDVVIPRMGNRVEPLLAAYSKECLLHIERQVGNGDYRIIDFFKFVRVRYMEEKEIKEFDRNLISFFNINTMEDYEKAKMILAEMEAQ